MGTPPDWIPKLSNPVLSVGKRVLAVEGIRDPQIYNAWLEKLAPPGGLVADKSVVVATGGKRELVNGLRWYRDEGDKPIIFDSD